MLIFYIAPFLEEIKTEMVKKGKKIANVRKETLEIPFLYYSLKNLI